jgi:hypothetical protein
VENNQILLTTISYLIEQNNHQIASLLVESELSIRWHETLYGEYQGIADCILDFPIPIFNLIENNNEFKKIIETALRKIMANQFYGGIPDNLPVVYRIKLMEIDDNWKEKVKSLISNYKDPNQGNITEIAFSKRGKPPILYNEMKFASQSEVRIAQELEVRRVLFFPLPLAVRADTGNRYEDHREVDFLICHDGVWGILEVAYHPDGGGRYEKDSEKHSWFTKSGILCIRHFTAEKCYNNPKDVISEFLSILAQFKK